VCEEIVDYGLTGDKRDKAGGIDGIEVHITATFPCHQAHLAFSSTKPSNMRLGRAFHQTNDKDWRLVASHTRAVTAQWRSSACGTDESPDVKHRRKKCERLMRLVRGCRGGREEDKTNRVGCGLWASHAGRVSTGLQASPEVQGAGPWESLRSRLLLGVFSNYAVSCKQSATHSSCPKLPESKSSRSSPR
jgi:hypothetical protein